MACGAGGRKATRGHDRPGQPGGRAARGVGSGGAAGGRAAAAPAGRRHRPRARLALRWLHARTFEAPGPHGPRAVWGDPGPAADAVEAVDDPRSDREAGGWRRGGAHRPWDCPLRRHDPARVRRRDEGIPPARLRRRRQDLPAGRPDRAHQPIQRRPGADPLQAWRDGLGAHQGAGATRRRGIGRGPARHLRRPRLGSGVQLLAGHDLAARAGGGLPVHRDEGPGADHPGGQGRHAPPPADGPPRVRRRGLRQDRGRTARRLQGRAGREAGRRAGADHRAGAAAPGHVPSAPGASRC